MRKMISFLSESARAKSGACTHAHTASFFSCMHDSVTHTQTHTHTHDEEARRRRVLVEDGGAPGLGEWDNEGVGRR